MTTRNEVDEALLRRQQGQPVWRWFDHKVRGHMEARQFQGMRPMMPPLGGQAVGSYLETPADQRERVLYVHIPFCRRICSFCAFIRQPSGGMDLAAYGQGLMKQLRRWAGKPWVQSGPAFKAVYFGGGTPTVLPAGLLAELVQCIGEHYPLARDAEITIEARFDGVDADYLQTIRAAGVNRVSFGVQSFDSEVRQSVGRIADQKQVLQLLDDAGRIGFDNISLDLIYNLPGQSLESWQQDMERLPATPATACSVYALIPMPGSALVKNIASGSSPSLGDLEHEYELWACASQAMRQRQGWRRFGFQHHGDAARETSIYNHARAGGMDVLGMGCGAGGMLGRISYMNPMKVPQYLAEQETQEDQGLMAFQSPAEVHARSPVYQMIEGDGIDQAQVLEWLPDSRPWLEKLAELALVEECEGKLRLTETGCFWAYNLMAFLTGEINRLLPASLDQGAGPSHRMPGITGQPHGLPHGHPHSHPHGQPQHGQPQLVQYQPLQHQHGLPQHGQPTTTSTGG